MYPKDLLKLMHYLKKLSGVGSKTAERFAFELLQWEDFELDDVGNLFKTLKKTILHCDTCGCLIAQESCKFCDSSLRDSKKMCIVSSFRDVFLLEKTKTYNGFYHILETLLSPIDGKEIDEENIFRLKKRIEKYKISEVIIALDSTIEGDATSLYIKEELLDYKIDVSRLVAPVKRESVQWKMN